MAKWQEAFWLQPLNNGALMRQYPDDWNVYQNSELGYKFKRAKNAT